MKLKGHRLEENAVVAQVHFTLRAAKGLISPFECLLKIIMNDQLTGNLTRQQKDNTVP
jgi:hypothetical protein